MKAKKIFLINKILLFTILFMYSANSALAQGVSFAGTQNNAIPPPDSGPGIRMMWYPERIAFRVGVVTADQWDNANVGLRSIAMGFNCPASGLGSICLGDLNSSSGTQSFTTGFFNVSTGDHSFSANQNNKATGQKSSSFGFFSESVGNISSVFGHKNKATAFSSFVIGQLNDTSHISKTTWNIDDPVFIIGNGLDESTRSNAFTVFKNGNTTISGALNFESTNVAVISDNQTVTVGSQGYIRLNSNNNTATNRTVLLTNGTNIGQMLILESSSAGTFKWQLEDSGNLNLSTTHDFGQGDTIQLIWNGSDWLEIHFSDN